MTALFAHPARAPDVAVAELPPRLGAVVSAVGMSLPETVVPSADLDLRLGLPSGWIERRTGIRHRHVAGPDARLEHAATAAGVEALARGGAAPEEVDLVLVATCTSDELMPGTAPLVAHALGAVGAGAFDISSACTGFLAALAVGAAQVESGRAACVLVIGADFMTRLIDPGDRSTCAVFADGAGAVLLRPVSTPGLIGQVVLGSDGSGADHIRVARNDATIRMRGHETFREAVARLSQVTREAADAADTALDEIDLFVYHQANGRILSTVGDRLGIAPERVVDCIGEYGNTSAATLPLALHWSERRGLLKPGSRVLLGAFGAGFTWAATLLTWAAEPVTS